MRYYVCTPPYDTHEWSRYQPHDWGSDVVEIEAHSKREARVRGLQELRRTHSRYLKLHEDENPFKGLQVEPMEDVGIGHKEHSV